MLQTEINALHGTHSSELSQLREALMESVGRCRRLEKLNEEAYGLIMIQSMRAMGIVEGRETPEEEQDQAQRIRGRAEAK